MAQQEFTVADFFRLANEAAAEESSRRIKEAEALAEIKTRLAPGTVSDAGERGLSDDHS